MANDVVTTIGGLSYDGSIVVGNTVFPSQPFLSVGAGPAEIITIPQNTTSGGSGGIGSLSSDGTVALGSFNDASTGSLTPFLLSTQTKSWTSIGNAPGWANTQGRGLSPDGNTVLARVSGADNLTSQGAAWSQTDGWQLLPSILDADDTYLMAASQNGEVIVGFGRNTSNNKRSAYRWTASEGSVALGLMGGDLSSEAHDITPDGRWIVGGAYDDGLSFNDGARIWDGMTGSSRRVSEVLSTAGVSFAGWDLGFANQISDDGLIIAGTGIDPDGHRQAWIANLAPVPEANQWLLMFAGLGVLFRVTRGRKFP